MNHGTEIGDVCNRNGCPGIIEEIRGDCYCAVTYPPCSACTDAYRACDTCGWDEATEAEEDALISKHLDKAAPLTAEEQAQADAILNLIEKDPA